MTTAKKEYPYYSDPKIMRIKDNLVNNFGYGKIEAREIAREVIANLNRYMALEELRIRNAKVMSDNRTLLERPKTILELRMEAKRGNI